MNVLVRLDVRERFEPAAAGIPVLVNFERCAHADRQIIVRVNGERSFCRLVLLTSLSRRGAHRSAGDPAEGALLRGI